MRDFDNLPMVTCKLSRRVRNKIFNSKETVNDIFIDGENTLNPYVDACSCSTSTFSDPHHKHIITGDLKIVENSKLSKLLTKGPNLRELTTQNFKIAFEKIKSAINQCIDNLSNKTSQPKQGG